MDLKSIIVKKKNALKPTTTFVYSCTGEVQIEKRDENGHFSITKTDKISPGYVIDTKPDLSVSFVFPWLCMGSQDVAHDYNLLKSHRITHILSVGIPAPHHEDIQMIFKEALDIEDFNLMDLFDDCCSIIDTVREHDGVIYVHCNAGVSRSASIVIAYYMYYKKSDYFQAFHAVKSKRLKIKPNRGFQLQLLNYADKLTEKRK